ncbi:hypothetical protein JKY72_04050 [Candidatus Gracilibacteria bacterium]|nr:hypothetical protein [Candidatus Gracilibacteria bacterium]
MSQLRRQIQVHARHQLLSHARRQMSQLRRQMSQLRRQMSQLRRQLLSQVRRQILSQVRRQMSQVRRQMSQVRRQIHAQLSLLCCLRYQHQHQNQNQTHQNQSHNHLVSYFSQTRVRGLKQMKLKLKLCALRTISRNGAFFVGVPLEQPANHELWHREQPSENDLLSLELDS